MKSLKLFIIPILLLLLSCGDDKKCQDCTGTVTNTGNMASWTICEEDGTVTQTNNITGESMVTTNGFVGSIAFLESLGLECDD